MVSLHPDFSLCSFGHVGHKHSISCLIWTIFNHAVVLTAETLIMLVQGSTSSLLLVCTSYLSSPNKTVLNLIVNVTVMGV